MQLRTIFSFLTKSESRASPIPASPLGIGTASANVISIIVCTIARFGVKPLSWRNSYDLRTYTTRLRHQSQRQILAQSAQKFGGED
ncbi:hypothetical protein FHX77_000460 [Bifidobacterium commune]|nr:hypothetical protein [Bifidobacterium commune]